MSGYTREDDRYARRELEGALDALQELRDRLVGLQDDLRADDSIRTADARSRIARARVGIGTAGLELCAALTALPAPAVAGVAS